MLILQMPDLIHPSTKQSFLEIQVIVITTFGIKIAVAKWTMVITRFVLYDGHGLFANATKNCFSIKFLIFPKFWFVNDFFLVTEIAGIITVATFEFNGNYIQV